MRSHPVRVSLPASVAADIGSLKKAVGSVLAELGCPKCCSGHDIYFDLQRDVVLPDGLRDQPVVALTSRKAVRSEPLRVGLSPKLATDIENVFDAIDRIADISGHPACATGCDMFFQLERTFVLDRRLAVRELALTVG
jgi:hypothetical protein